MSASRLDKLLSARGYCTRSQARRYLRDVDVRVDGARQSREDVRVEDRASVTVDGEPIDAARIYAALHKPLGVVCGHDEGEGRLVYDLLPERWSQRNPVVTTVGRLDKETSGLLIVTDDGTLVHRLTSPKRHVAKVYRVTVAKPLSGSEAAAFALGALMLNGDDKPLLPAMLEVLGERDARLTIVEGRYHQVRRMFAALGNHVETLHRERVGSLELGDLATGAWRMLNADEIAALSSRA